MQHRTMRYKWILFFIILFLALGVTVPVLANYLGPNRTVTTTVPYCNVTKYRCAQQNNGGWDYKSTEDWLCSNESKPWEGCSSNSPSCNEGNSGHTYCERHEGTREETITHPSATIQGAIVNCTLSNGWCGVTLPELALSATEPLAGYNITLIEGTLNSTSFACQPGEMSCNIPMNQGDNIFNYWALSSWGDSSLMGTTTVKVDTVPPEVTLNVTGTAGNHGWYKSPIQVVANPLDATSGVATFEVAVDGGGYQAYTTPISFTNDARHTLQFRTMDNAGNLFESPVQNFFVDTIPPTVNLRGSWELGRNVPYDVMDEGSGLDTLRIVIEDEDEKFAKVAWDEDHVSGRSYSQDIDWNGQFKDKTVAPPGTYLVWLKARDVAGNEHFELGKVVVPEPNYVGAVVLPTEDASVVVVPPAELSQPEETASLGASSEGTKTTTTTHSFTLTSGAAGGTTSSSAATSSSGVLWGAAAAAAISAATAYALETTRKRKEAEEAQAAAVRAEVAKDKAKRAEKGLTKEEKKAEKAKRADEHDQKVEERKERQSWENPAKEKARLKQQEEAYQKWRQEQQQLANVVPPDGIPTYAQSVYVHGGPPVRPEDVLSPAQLQFIAQQERNKKEGQAAQAAKQAEQLAKLPGYSSEKQAASSVTIAKPGGPKVLAALAIDNDPPEDPGPLKQFWNWLTGLFIPRKPVSTQPDAETLAKAYVEIFTTQTAQAQVTPTFTPTIVPTSTLIPTPRPDRLPMVVLADGLNLRVTPGLYQPSVIQGSIPKGATVFVDSTAGVKIEDNHCWVKTIYTDPKINAQAVGASPQFLNPLVGFNRWTSQGAPITYPNGFSSPWVGTHIGEDYVPLPGGDANPVVVASTTGTVTNSGTSSGGYGNYVIVQYKADALPVSIKNLPEYQYNGKTDNSIYGVYGHFLNDVSNVLGPGVPVNAGTQLGQMGMSGNGGGMDHLHFELRVGLPDQPLNGFNGDLYNPDLMLPLNPAKVITVNDTFQGWSASSQCTPSGQPIGDPLLGPSQ